MNEVVLSLGTNVGDRALNMQRMSTGVMRFLHEPVRFSSLMKTDHVGEEERPFYYNRLVRGQFDGTPHDLLAQCQAVEQELGRRREGRYSPRTADIDILLFGDLEVAEADLCIPHPALLQRRFCIVGLAEIAGEVTIPRLEGSIGRNAAGLLERLGVQTIEIVESGRSCLLERSDRNER